MKRKLYTFTILFLLSINWLYAISFGFHAFEIRTNPEFSKGVLPTSLVYQFDFPVPDFIEGNASEINFRIDNGIDFRTLRQDPETGRPFSDYLEIDRPDYPKDYITIYDEMNLIFGQGFFRTPYSNNDLLKLWVTFDIRFENAYERLSYLYDSDNREALFITEGYPNGTERFSSWIGQPELAGNRSTTNFSFSLGFDFDMMQDDITRRKGVKNSFRVRLNPAWTDWMNSDSNDFLFFWDKLDLAFTPVAINMQGDRDTTWFSMVIDNSTVYRYITGEKVPYYLQGGQIFGTSALNTEHVVTNRTSLTFYGPQINSYDCYPYISAFVDLGFSFGTILNSVDRSDYFESVASVGIRAEFVIFNIASFYYEIGYVIDNVLNEQQVPVLQFGFSFGV